MGNNSNWNTSFVDITPAGIGSPRKGIAAGGYYYYCEDTTIGCQRALLTNIAANYSTPASIAWQTIHTGQVKQVGAPTNYDSLRDIKVQTDGSGDLYAVFGTNTDHQMEFCKFSQSGVAWTCTDISSLVTWGLPQYLVSIAEDANGNYYIAHNVRLIKSTNGGSSFTNVSASFLQSLGYDPSFIFQIDVIGGFLYISGECACFSKVPLTLDSATLLTNPSSDFTHNGRAFATDGTLSVAPSAELILGQTYQSTTNLSHYDINTATWSAVGAIPLAPLGGSGTTDFYLFPRDPQGGIIPKGKATHEYYVGAAVQPNFVVEGTIDGGVTWASVGQLFTSGDPLNLAVDATTDAKFLAGATQIWYHPAPSTIPSSVSGVTTFKGVTHLT